jgi:hypothetical protein
MLNNQDKTRVIEIDGLKKIIKDLRMQNAELIEKNLGAPITSIIMSEILRKPKGKLKVLHITNMDEACPSKFVLESAAYILGFSLNINEVKGLKKYF